MRWDAFWLMSRPSHTAILSKPHNLCRHNSSSAPKKNIFMFHGLSVVFHMSCRTSHIPLLTSQRSRPRPISTGPLHTSPYFHSQPIYLIIYQGSYQIKSVGNLILRLASHLDAFSAYPFQIWPPSCASGETTGTPVICPSRSSRTKDSSSQISCACDG